MPEVNFGYGGSSSGSSAGATEGQTDGNVTDINNGNGSLTPPDINDGNNGELNKNNGTEDVNKIMVPLRLEIAIIIMVELKLLFLMIMKPVLKLK